MRTSLRAAAGLSSTLVLALSAFAGCGGDPQATTTGTTTASGGGSATSGSGGSGGAPLPDSYKPAGCQFEIAPRPEYLEWSTAQTDTLPTPNIRRVRLGLGGNVAVGASGRADPATTIGVAWQTDDGTHASEITWGSAPDPATWPKENRASGVTWLTPQGLFNPNGDARMHEVHLCGLTPATTYYYRAGGGPEGKEVWSDVYSFTTTPANADTPVTLALNGDARGQNGEAWRLFQRKLLPMGITLQLFSGDTVAFAQDQTEWEKWLDLAWKDQDGSLLTLGQVLTLSTNGNHDNRSTLFFGNQVMPQDAKQYAPYAELFYSFDVGPVHVTVVDDSFLVAGVIAQADRDAVSAWLDADLTAANQNRAKVPWLITMHHHGPFSSSSHDDDSDVLRGRAFFVPLNDKHHVDLDVAGHDHNYERSKSLTGPADLPTLHDDGKTGTTYLICAGAGAPAYSPGVSAFTALSKGYDSGGAVGVYGILKASKTELALDAYELRPDGTDPKFDSFVITQ